MLVLCSWILGWHSWGSWTKYLRTEEEGRENQRRKTIIEEREGRGGREWRGGGGGGDMGCGQTGAEAREEGGGGGESFLMWASRHCCLWVKLCYTFCGLLVCVLLLGMEHGWLLWPLSGGGGISFYSNSIPF